MSWSFSGLRHLHHRIIEFAYGIGDRRGLGCIQTSSILQLKIGVVAEKVRRADGIISSCNLLVFIEEIGKWQRFAFAKACMFSKLSSG